ELIEMYQEELGKIPGIRFPALREGVSSSWNYMVILVEDGKAPFSRDELFQYLKEQGIQTKRYFFPPVHLMDVYRRLLGDGVPRLPVTERVARNALALPLYSHMDDGTVLSVCRAVHSLAETK
ncbi:MAG: DegT/DnrJ/EryC1/StrS family aminotransferase, partial [Acidobacteriota bacterium]